MIFFLSRIVLIFFFFCHESYMFFAFRRTDPNLPLSSTLPPPTPPRYPLVRVVITPDGVDAVMRLGQGDMRRVLNLLQSTHMAYQKVRGERGTLAFAPKTCSAASVFLFVFGRRGRSRVAVCTTVCFYSCHVLSCLVSSCRLSIGNNSGFIQRSCRCEKKKATNAFFAKIS